MFESKEETTMQTVYILGEVTYVPHFRNTHVYVGPGYPRFTRQRYSVEELRSAGAKQGALPLWHRSNIQVVTDKNP